MRIFNTLLLLILVVVLTGCSMVSWNSGFESEYTENEDGTLTTNDGKILNSKGEIIDFSIDPENPDDPEDPGDNSEEEDTNEVVDNTDDPYRKYDDGVITYNYNEMSWVKDRARIYYIKKDTGALHGMHINTLDGNVENGIISITFYYDGEEIRHVEYLDYPLIEADYCYFDVWTEEFYFYFDGTEEVMQYYKKEYIDEQWMEVENIRYYENGTINLKQTFSTDGQTSISYDQNGMITRDFEIVYPTITSYIYLDDGTLSVSLEGTIASHLTYNDFMDVYTWIAPFRYFLESVENRYRASGVIEETIMYGPFMKHIIEYDENGTITFEEETGYSEYSEGNTPVWRVTKTYIDGVLNSENCWDSDEYYYCKD